MKKYTVKFDGEKKTVRARHEYAAVNKAFNLGRGYHWDWHDPQTAIVTDENGVKWHFSPCENG